MKKWTYAGNIGIIEIIGIFWRIARELSMKLCQLKILLFDILMSNVDWELEGIEEAEIIFKTH